jgi:hypothetical protein
MNLPSKSLEAINLLDLLSKVSTASNLTNPEWKSRRVLVCHPAPPMRTRIVEDFASAKDFDVLAADRLDTALSLLREGRVNIVVFDYYFDPDQHGADVLRRYVDQLKPKIRRQLYLVLLHSNYRTLDPNAAFIEGVNAVVNSDEISLLRPALERSLREYNQLYKTFYEVSGIQPF